MGGHDNLKFAASLATRYLLLIVFTPPGIAQRVVRAVAIVLAALSLPFACTTPTPPSPASTPSASAATAPFAAAPGDAAVDSSSSIASASASASASVASVEASPPLPTGIVIGKGTRVFIFGDSMVNAGLGQRLQKLVEDRGGLYFENHWSSSTTKAWSVSDRLANLIFKYKPDVVFVTLGSNEVYYLDTTAAKSVKAITSKFADKPCVWIGPPVWKTQKGIVEIERDNSSPCAFFDSQTLTLDRQKDGIHPSVKGGRVWADAVWSATVAPSAAPAPVSSNGSEAIAAASASPSASTSATE
jgi:lysophospholipase L1-like esterase